MKKCQGCVFLVQDICICHLRARLLTAWPALCNYYTPLWHFLLSNVFGSLSESETVSIWLLTLFWFKHGSRPRTNLLIFVWYISISLGNLPPPPPFSLPAALPSPTHPSPCHPSSWACLSCLPSGRKFVKDVPSAASKPETLFFATVVHLHVPTHSLRPDRQRPPTAGPRKGPPFPQASQPSPFGGTAITVWVWVWALFFQEAPDLDTKIVGFYSEPPWGGKPATWTWQNQYPITGPLYQAVPCLPHPHLQKQPVLHMGWKLCPGKTQKVNI